MAVEIIMSNWRKYIVENDPAAAEQIMLAANFSGRAINIAQTTAAHAMSYKITSLYGLPHGHAVAICLPEIWEFMLGNLDRCIDSRGSMYLSGIFTDISKSMNCKTTVDAIAGFRQMLALMELKNPMGENCKDEITVLSSSVNSIRLKNNPVELNIAGIQNIYGRIILSVS